MKGYTYPEVAEKIPYANKRYILSTVVRRLKESKRITQEQIEQAKFERTGKRRLELVLKGLKAGLTAKETADLDKSITLSEQQYRECRSKLIESGKITEEEIEQKRKLADTLKEEERKEDYDGPLDKEIMRLTRLKMTGAQIAEKLHTTESYVSTRKKEVRRRKNNQKRGVSKEKLEECFRKGSRGVSWLFDSF